jgi:hypothetical protein
VLAVTTEDRRDAVQVAMEEALAGSGVVLCPGIDRDGVRIE